ncbi:MAG: thiamine pyrophosphate-dependent enzyme [Polyangia bacterium]
MSKLSENLMKKEPWSAMIMGNQALARAMIESGVRVATTYPGSPTPEIAAALTSVDESKRPYYFEYSTNEKVALEVAVGASLNGHRSTCFFKSVGLNVASDSLIQLSMMELIGGLVIVLGDDPGANSSQNEQDNRHFSRMSYIPMLEPATPREAYEMYLEAMRISRETRAPILLRTTTHVNHAREVVEFGALGDEKTDWTPGFSPDNGPYVPITVTVHSLKARALEKLDQLAEGCDRTRFDRILPASGGEKPGGKRRGVISAGLPALAVQENLEESGAPIDLLKLGMTYPLPRAELLEFLESHDEVLVVEELDRVMEGEIKVAAFDAGIGSCRILARTRPEDLQGELVPHRSWRILSEAWPSLFAARPEPAVADAIPRLPQLCPGCGHRSAFHAVKNALGSDAITVADIGCHSMGYMPPYEMGQVLLCMGHATATASGLALGGHDRGVLAFIGDGTMIHAGLPGVINAIVNDHDVTLVLLENGTTAMTGHQPRPGSGERGAKIPWVPLFEALGCKMIRDVDAYQQAELTAHVREALDHRGFSVVIARHPCMLKFTREQRRKIPGFGLPRIRVDADECDQLHVCVSQFGCPSFVLHEDGSVTTHPDLCIGDGSCLPTCPVEALYRPAPGGEK